ncbi:hypothetical protein Ddye_006718 [Dipteronia dyeriana]|uniref:Cytochrome P450 n=1 Tax=Dipteronia dyeriana TaxID=168575 RepID=A0AAD9XJ03_9ROSI|nr:hypothetical protein Ddye_006718 [Dipteronia dyeriana]
MMILHFVLFAALYMLTNHLIKKIKNLPPSPFSTLPIIGHLYLFKKPLHRSLSKISSKYGPILFLKFGSRPVLVVSSPSAAEDCFSKNDVVFANRPRLLAGKYLGSNYTSLSWVPYGDHWRNLRRISSLEILSTNRLQALSSIRMDEVKSLIQRLYRNQNQEVEMKPVFFEFTLNVMMRMIAGKRYDGDENDAGNYEESKRIQEIVTETFRLGGAVNVVDFLPVLKWVGFGGVEMRLMVLGKKRDRFMQDLIEKHRTKMDSNKSEDCLLDGDRKKSMIEVLLSLQESEPQCYSDEIISSLMIVLLTAGTDTSAGTMEWAMSLLLNNPNILKKAQTEIDNIIGLDHLINESDLAKLPYLNCIINETLRMFPAAPLSVPRESSEDCNVGGYHVPRGTMLLVNMWGIQNDPKIWEDPGNFRPERFEGFEGKKSDGLKLLAFGSGRRSCPGDRLATRMVGLALGSLLQCFEWERISEEMVDMTEGNGVTLPMAHPLQAKCRPRTTTLFHLL